MMARVSKASDPHRTRRARERGKLRIALVGGRGLCRLCLQALLKQLLRSAETVEVAPGAAPEQVAAACANSDVVLYSAICPEELDLSALEGLSRAAPGVRIVVHTDSEDPAYLEDLIAHGAAGVIPTSSTGDVAIAALRLVAAGGTHIPAGLVHVAPKAEPRTRIFEGAPNGRDRLTRREAQVFALVAEGMTNKEAAHRLGLAVPTVKIHVRNIFRKLGVKNRTQLAHLAARLKP